MQIKISSLLPYVLINRVQNSNVNLQRELCAYIHY